MNGTEMENSENLSPGMSLNLSPMIKEQKKELSQKSNHSSNQNSPIIYRSPSRSPAKSCGSSGKRSARRSKTKSMRYWKDKEVGIKKSPIRKRPKSCSIQAKMKWDAALEEMKRREENRFNLTKSITISQYRQDEVEGLVRRRINEWEEIFMLMAPTPKELERLRKHLYHYNREESKRRQSLEYRNNPNRDEPGSPPSEDISLGTTRVYDVRDLREELSTFLKQELLESGSNMAPLSCGVIQEIRSDESLVGSSSPSVRLTCMAARSESDDIYLLINVQGNSHEDPAGPEGGGPDPRVYGRHKVAFFSHDGVRTQQHEVNVVRTCGESDVGSTSVGSKSSERVSKLTSVREEELSTKERQEKVITELNLGTIDNIQSTVDFLLLKEKKDGVENFFIFDKQLRRTTAEATLVSRSDRIYEWVRHLSASGWLTKYPMKSQNFGRASRRFFVLRENQLAYYRIAPTKKRYIPQDFELIPLEGGEPLQPAFILELDVTTTVDIALHRYQRCIRIRTAVEELCLKSEKDSDLEVYWVNKLQKAVQQVIEKKHPNPLSPHTIKTHWSHEEDNFILVAADAVDSSGSRKGRHSVRVGLFTLANSDLKKREEKNLVGEEEFFLSVQTGLQSFDELKVKLEKNLKPVELTCIKVLTPSYSDLNPQPSYCTIIIGGSDGFLGIGSIDFSNPNKSLKKRVFTLKTITGPYKTNKEENTEDSSPNDSPLSEHNSPFFSERDVVSRAKIFGFDMNPLVLDSKGLPNSVLRTTTSDLSSSSTSSVEVPEGELRRNVLTWENNTVSPGDHESKMGSESRVGEIKGEKLDFGGDLETPVKVSPLKTALFQIQQLSSVGKNETSTESNFFRKPSNLTIETSWEEKKASIRFVEVSPDRQFFLAVDENGNVKLWKLLKSGDGRIAPVGAVFQSQFQLQQVESQFNIKEQRVLNIVFLPLKDHFAVTTNYRLMFCRVSVHDGKKCISHVKVIKESSEAGIFTFVPKLNFTAESPVKGPFRWPEDFELILWGIKQEKNKKDDKMSCEMSRAVLNGRNVHEKLQNMNSVF